MAFSTLRGRPRTHRIETDFGTPELRLKHALGVTAEPIDLCLGQALITTDQHWCALHLRWLYTLRYGAPVLTMRYHDLAEYQPTHEELPQWREEREREYQDCMVLLKQQRRYEPVMRVCVFNELPAFLNQRLKTRARKDHIIGEHLLQSHHKLSSGLDILVKHWQRGSKSTSQS